MKSSPLRVVARQSSAPVPPSSAGAASLRPDRQDPLDMSVKSLVARATGGISPLAMGLAFQDWYLHLLVAPGKCAELAGCWTGALAGASASAAPDDDRRFADPAWGAWPFRQYAWGFRQVEHFWQRATSGVAGVGPHHAEVVRFAARQLLDMWSPSNFPWTNPEILRAAWASGGASLAAGWLNWRQDACRHLAPPGAAVSEPLGAPYVPGVDVALTPGKVVFRNALIELIQYNPQTDAVYREPVLIVPSWIMKYYILDLSPHNSLVGYLVRKGHTVLMISWRNPDARDRDLGLADYLRQGLLAGLEQAGAVGGGAPVHAVGYCLGGTLLAMAAALHGDDQVAGRKPLPAPLASISLIAAQTDFSEPGELGLFIDDSELAFLDALMWEQGYLTGDQMAASFQLLHARDLVWSRMMREYLLGRRSAPNDLMAWNADSTRLPFRMHSEYLHQLFLRNDLAEGRYLIDGKPVLLSSITAPMFVLATERDHVSPWRSVYKIHQLCDVPVEFVLASGGHNAGVVSEPGHPGRSYLSLATGPARPRRTVAAQWVEHAHRTEGSWWPHWQHWLARHSSPHKVAPPAPPAPVLGAAPGLYVVQP